MNLTCYNFFIYIPIIPLNIETQRIIKDLSVELGKQKGQSINISKEQLVEAVKDESHVIQSLAIQLHKRLSQMIVKEKKSQL